MSSLPYFRWYPADAKADESYSLMSDQALGFFHRCLNHAWDNNGLPADFNKLALALNVTRRYLDYIWPQVRVHFEENSGRFFNPRQEQERSRAIAISNNNKRIANANASRSTKNSGHLSDSDSDSDSDKNIKPKPPAPKTGADSLGPRPVPSKKRKHRSTEEIRSALGERLPWWEGFWAVYPCHEGMNDAMDAFEKLVHERDLAVEIFRGAEAYAARARADPEMKLKYGQGWLNAERWRDENKIAPAPQKKDFYSNVASLITERIAEGKAPW